MTKGQIAGLMKQVQQMQENMEKTQEQLALIEVEDVSNAGLVRVVITYKNDVRRVPIDLNLLAEGEDKDLLEDLIVAAFNDVVHKVEATAQEKVGLLISGLGGVASVLPPSFELPFQATFIRAVL